MNELQLFIFIYNFCFISSIFQIDVADKERDFIILIQVVPQKIGKCIHIITDRYQLRFTFKAWKRIAIMHIGMDKMSLTSFWVLVSEGVTMAGIRVTVIAL